MGVGETYLAVKGYATVGGGMDFGLGGDVMVGGGLDIGLGSLPNLPLATTGEVTGVFPASLGFLEGVSSPIVGLEPFFRAFSLNMWWYQWCMILSRGLAGSLLCHE